MMDAPDHTRWSLPLSRPYSADPRRRRTERALRIAAYVLLAIILIAVVVQFQHGTAKRLRDGFVHCQRSDINQAMVARSAPPKLVHAMKQSIRSTIAAGEDAPRLKADGTPPQLKNRAELKPRPTTKGAMARWRTAFRDFWAGENIYTREAGLHPNMPFTVILLSPLAYLSPTAMAATLSALKLAVLAASILMAARLAGQGRSGTRDWIVGLALLWSLQLLISDIQHGNTNIFVLGLILLHLWLFRLGKDVSAGAALAVAICLKMTPALFVLYWLYQRNWRLLAGTAVAGVVFVVGVPALAVGPGRYAALMDSWLNNLIIPGLVKGAWYPIHVNQSLSGVMSRYFLAGANGDAFWNPDDYHVHGQQPHTGWITLVALSEPMVKMMLRGLQALVVGAMAWGIGWRKLPRDDGRRMLHYGIVALGMMILNQRTWMHHAPVLLIATVAIWRAIAFGRMPRLGRKLALVGMLLAGPLLWLSASDLYKALARATGDCPPVGEYMADYVDAYGPTFWFFMLLLAVSVLLARSMRQVAPPYAERRQTLSDELT